ncbi:hypothetical protein GR925_28235 [Streptomyces sp. HUCO-GS316]|uniref:hypothetical protein n=1 Tax=Streptomyces sp. HUCO-GS316 TaxID=2692198 RepID=UPI00136F0EB6|nr:hypothetical protein [Streptomyces sp. HUCO-GS316]MXM67215.1 hypothetical protein [Streptomyces sp. HUCO-GS316]
MADEQYSWLDRETAERLLRGEPLDNAVEAAALDEAQRLAKTLGALSAEPPLNSTELPGEAAALAAFRTARSAREGREEREVRSGEQPAGHRADTQVTDAGLVRIGGPDRRARRPRWGRPLRLGLAAALAAGMVGGVAVAAGTGALPTPFDDTEPGPAASVSAAVTPPGPQISPAPDPLGGEPTPDGTTSAAPGQGSHRDTARGGQDTGPATGSGPTRDPSMDRAEPRRAAAAACRDVRDGKLLTTQRRRALEGVAGGSARVWRYCRGVLAAGGEGSADQDGRDGGRRGDDGSGRGSDQGRDEGEGQGGNRGGHGEARRGHGGHGRHLAPGRGNERDRGRDHDRGKDRDRSGDGAGDTAGADTASSAVPPPPQQSAASPSVPPTPSCSAL